MTPEQRIAELELQLAAEVRRADRLERTLRSLLYRGEYWRRGDVGQAYVAGRASAYDEISQACAEGIAWSRGKDGAGTGL